MPQRFINLTRADVLGQAISFVRASQTGAWISTKSEQREPAFEAAAITRAIRFMRQQDEKWEQLFEKAGIEPYRMAYETLVADMEGELAGLLRFLGIEHDAERVARVVGRTTSVHRKQRDGVSQEWRDRYREIVRERAEERALQPS